MCCAAERLGCAWAGIVMGWPWLGLDKGWPIASSWQTIGLAGCGLTVDWLGHIGHGGWPWARLDRGWP